MGKVTMKWDLDDPRDELDFLCATYSRDTALFIWQLKHNLLRKAIKDALSPSEIVKLINEKIDDLGFDIDRIIE
jgi:hypothetical protein